MESPTHDFVNENGFLYTTSLVRYLVEKSGKKPAQISREIGRTSGYVGSLLSHEVVPGISVLAAIANACGYGVAVFSRDEALEVGPALSREYVEELSEQPEVVYDMAQRADISMQILESGRRWIPVTDKSTPAGEAILRYLIKTYIEPFQPHDTDETDGSADDV